MKTEISPTMLEKSLALFADLVADKGLLDTDVSVLAKTLTPEEAIGEPGRRDFPILIGKERMIEATAMGAKGQAFTDSAREFVGTLAEVLELRPDINQNRAIMIATMNAVLAGLGMTKATVHCKDDDPEDCAGQIASKMLEDFGLVKVGLIGLNPAIAEALAKAFGPERFRVTDLNPDNIGKTKFGVEIWGGERTEELIERSDLLIVTGTTITNGTFDHIWNMCEERNTRCIIFGVTAAAVAYFMGLERICPCGREG